MKVNELELHVATQVNLKNIVLSKKGRLQNIYSKIAFNIVLKTCK